MSSQMKQVQGIFLPASEVHMSDWIVARMKGHPEEMVNGRGTYQYHKLLAAMKWVRNFGVAVDVGAHCGMWSMHLAARFQRVYAFEPVALHRECFERNVALVADPKAIVQMLPFALGDEEKLVAFHTTATSSGDSWVDDGPGDVQVKLLDNVLTDEKIDFIKLDCEGYELFALKGGEQLLRRSRPCIIVEQKPGRAQKYGLQQTEALDWLYGLGAELRREMSGDYILSWPDAPKVEERRPAEAEIESFLGRREQPPPPEAAGGNPFDKVRDGETLTILPVEKVTMHDAGGCAPQFGTVDKPGDTEL